MTESLLDPRHCVANNLFETARAVARLYAEEMRRAGLARSQFAILNHLDRSGATALTALADRLYMDRTTMTRNLAPLERAGLVLRECSADDARVKVICISADGRRKLLMARRLWRKAQRRMLKLLGEAQWRELESQLTALRRLVK